MPAVGFSFIWSRVHVLLHIYLFFFSFRSEFRAFSVLVSCFDSGRRLFSNGSGMQIMYGYSLRSWCLGRLDIIRYAWFWYYPGYGLVSSSSFYVRFLPWLCLIYLQWCVRDPLATHRLVLFLMFCFRDWCLLVALRIWRLFMIRQLRLLLLVQFL